MTPLATLPLELPSNCRLATFPVVALPVTSASVRLALLTLESLVPPAALVSVVVPPEARAAGPLLMFAPAVTFNRDAPLYISPSVCIIAGPAFLRRHWIVAVASSGLLTLY